MKNKSLFILLCLFIPLFVTAQTSVPTNGANDPQVTRYTLVNANIHVSADVLIERGTLEIEDGKIKAVKKQGEKYDTTAIVIDVKGNHIYPSFIDIYSDYGMPSASEKKKERSNQYETDKKGAYGWNEAIKPETDAAQLFTHNAKAAEELRSLGFGAVATSVHDGVSRGTSVFVTLGDEKENKSIIQPNASANFSFKKGSSTQAYPGSLMGSIALLRQTFYDAQAYQRGYFTETNLSLDALNNQLKLPLLFEASSKWDILRIQKLGREFNHNYIIKTNGDEYQLAGLLKKTQPKLVVPLSFPAPVEVKSFFDEAGQRFTDLKHRQLAPFNPKILQDSGLTFAFTLAGLKDKKVFLKNIEKAIMLGLDKKTALNALTIIPAKYLKIDDKVGTLEKGKLANFIIVDGELFLNHKDPKSNKVFFLENWVMGEQFLLEKEPPYFFSGGYMLRIGEAENIQIRIGFKPDKKIDIMAVGDSSFKVDKISYFKENQQITFNVKTPLNKYILSGWKIGNILSGIGSDKNGKSFKWQAIENEWVDSTKEFSQKPPELMTDYSITQPYSYAKPTENTFLIRNVTVWTNEKEGVLRNADVLVVDGKISKIGDFGGLVKPQGENTLVVINGAGKHLTAGIIDEHSHIGITGGVNEGTQSSTAEVRIGDVINPEDINIYRQLAGGVTTSQLLHGSANTIGGQSAVIKLKWGQLPDSMVFAGAPGRIKFALGENVKQANWGEKFTERFPQTRMGVEMLFEDAFTRAIEYEKQWADFKSGKTKKEPRKDIELDALVEVVRGKRLITCHSYNQQEINMLMKVAEKFGFRINIFTHVLEGYKVADKLKEHGAGASSFSDWWGYKYEVIEATPYNPALLNQTGVITCINSDDAEMGRRLNQEAAKAVKYGGMSEEDALKMITLNPAKLMKIDNRVGSIAIGKDADLVLWSGHPLSIYSKPVTTFIEGVAYFNLAEHQKAEEQLKKEKQQLLEAMRSRIATGEKPNEAKKEEEKLYHCDDIEVYGEEEDAE